MATRQRRLSHAHNNSNSFHWYTIGCLCHGVPQAPSPESRGRRQTRGQTRGQTLLEWAATRAWKRLSSRSHRRSTTTRRRRKADCRLEIANHHHHQVGRFFTLTLASSGSRSLKWFQFVSFIVCGARVPKGQSDLVSRPESSLCKRCRQASWQAGVHIE